MQKVPKPANEKERLKSLYDYEILDTKEEIDYDGITEIAAGICDTPISLVSFVDKDRQWFKSHFGMTERETPISSSFCAHAILNPNDIFIVPDTSKNDVFFNNPLVTGSPNIGFYAGVPLVNEDGIALGTLCVIDSKPRELSCKQIKALKSLALQVNNLLRLRKKTMDLNKALFKNKVLLKEVNHRVKNNLQLVVNLLAIEKLNNPSLSAQMDSLNARIMSIAKVHEELYHVDEGHIDLKYYLKDLIDQIVAAVFHDKDQINVIFQSENIRIDSSKALLVGLIVNELIINSMKYAFVHGEKSEFYFNAELAKNKTIEFHYGDNGQRVVAHDEFEMTEGLGQEIILSLVDELNGELKRTRKNELGYHCILYLNLSDHL
ncbi:MAG: histidine kinase dimerization/phosphoacceptor domain -containing protein [Cyclobacteriaceae bacterium]